MLHRRPGSGWNGGRAALGLALATAVFAGLTGRAQESGRIPPARKRVLERMQSLSPQTLDSLNRLTGAEAFQARLAGLEACGNLGVAARPADPDAPVAVHRYLEKELARLAPWGVTNLGVLTVTVAVPVPVLEKGPAAGVAIGAESWPLLPVWPNGAMPSIAPSNGVEGPLVWVEEGRWADIDGLDLAGSVALMRFGGGRNWERLYSLGCAAVIVVEDDHVNRDNAEGLFCSTPLPCPRFYADRATGEALLARAARKGVAGARCRLTGGTVYANRRTRSWFAYLPPTRPLVLMVRKDDLIERIAADFDVTAVDLIRENGPGSSALVPGQSLSIPASGRRYRVKPRDLLARLSVEYGIPEQEILRASGLSDPELKPGARLVIPNAPDAMMILTRIDSVCAIPGGPQGGKAAGNMAATLTTLEHLATAESLVRRRGLVVGFLDGDSLGGAASRAFAGSVLRAQGELKPLASITGGDSTGDESRLRRYESVMAWMADFTKPLDGEAARWMTDVWLNEALERRRVALAEQRVAAIRAAQDPALPEAARAAGMAQAESCDSLIGYLVELRRQSLGNERVGAAERAAALLRAVEAPGAGNRARELGVDAAALRRQLGGEYAEEREALDTRRSNAALTQRVLAALHPGLPASDAVRRPAFGWLVDVSDGSPSLMFHTGADGRNQRLPAAADAQALAKRILDIPGFAGSQAGWTDHWTFVSGRSRAEYMAVDMPRPPFYAEFWSPAGLALVPLVTANDAQPRLDTPHDTVSRLDARTLGVQARTVALLTAAAVEDVPDFAFRGTLPTAQFGRVTGRTLRFNMRSGIDAREPVPHAWVYYPGGGRDDGASVPNAGAGVGTRRGMMALSLLNGEYEGPLESLSFGGRNHLLGYRLDRDRGLFDMVLDNGQIGTQAQTPVFPLVAGQESEKNLILAELCPLVLFPGVDPMAYLACKGAVLTDAVLQGPPAHFGRDEPAETYGESDVMGMVLYAEKGRRMTVSVPRQMALGGPLPAGALSRGEGYRIGPDASGSVALPLTPLLIGRDWHELALRRLALYRSFGIRDQGVEEAMRLAGAKRADAETEAARRHWQAALGAAREAWGLVEKNYPRIMTLGREAVFSVVILMALLLPGCYFIERLTFGARTVLGQLGGMTVYFVAGTAFLKVFHPAFQVALSPFIVMIAFIMILMSLVVLGICYQRFEVLVRRARVRDGEGESEEISLASSLATAFSLGVSNLRKRPARTALTVFTVAVLTFSIVAFVSVRGQDALRVRPLALDRDVEGRLLRVDEVEAPAYRGVLFRGFVWSALSDTFVSSLQTEFGARYEVATRAYYVEREGGNAADAEGVNQIEVRRGERTATVNAIMAFEPAETRFTGLQRAVCGGSWFREAAGTNEADRFAVILPAAAADTLGLGVADILEADGRRRPEAALPVVRMSGSDWKVIGILDPDRADRIRDVNGKSPAMVDYLRSAITPGIGSGFVENESDVYHLSWRRLALVPMSARQDIRARFRSVAVRFQDGRVPEDFTRSVAARLNTAMFGNLEGQPGLMTARQAFSIGGLAKILVPVILCFLIIMNTMMGSIDERKGEIQMLGAVGLSPRQIAFLMLSESTVYSVLGIVFGAFGGLLFARVAPAYPGLFGALSFNFTSLASTGLALATGVVVLLATLLPARRAAALAAPSGMEKWVLPAPTAAGEIGFELPFTLTRGNAVGMAAFFRRYLLHHTDASSPDFNCREIDLAVVADGADAIRLRARMWLAPYDLDVAQSMDLRIRPSSRAGVFRVSMVMRRTSGSEEAWLRTNYRFMDGVRQQFLNWRNLDRERRKRCVDEGAGLIRNAPPAMETDHPEGP